MSKGRKPIYGNRMKSNGLPHELDKWYTEQARVMGLKSGTELKRLVLEKVRNSPAFLVAIVEATKESA